MHPNSSIQEQINHMLTIPLLTVEQSQLILLQSALVERSDTKSGDHLFLLLLLNDVVMKKKIGRVPNYF